jgi:hypothetical protein
MIPQMTDKAKKLVTPASQSPPEKPVASLEDAASRPTEVAPPPADKVDASQLPLNVDGDFETGSRTEQLLEGIQEQLKSIQREDMFDDFSVVRLVGGLTQIGVFFCLLITVWFLLSPDRPTDPIYMSLGFALVLQVMSLTFSMHGRR